MDPDTFSNYFKGLPAEYRLSHSNKLILSNGVRLPDQYSPSGQWVRDPTKWPKLQCPDIYVYLVEKPSVYTKEKLKAYKSLDAYNFVLCGHVQDIEYRDLPNGFCTLRTDMLPSQQQGHKTQLYKTWAIVNKLNKYILTANCTCMAG